MSDQRPPLLREGPMATGFLFGLGFWLAGAIVAPLVAWAVVWWLQNHH
jgi:hypothetical protein